jgi:hypothetical protein
MLGCARADLAGERAPSSPGPLMDAGNSWAQGAERVMQEVLKGRPGNARAAEVLGLLALDDNEPDDLRSAPANIVIAVEHGVATAGALRACAELAARTFAEAASRRCSEQALRTGPSMDDSATVGNDTLVPIACEPGIIRATPFRFYPRWQTDYDDRGVVWMRVGAPTKRIRSRRPAWGHLSPNTPEKHQNAPKRLPLGLPLIARACCRAFVIVLSLPRYSSLAMQVPQIDWSITMGNDAKPGQGGAGGAGGGAGKPGNPGKPGQPGAPKPK